MATRLDGQDRTLDALIGLIVLVAELMIGYLSLTALYEFGRQAALDRPWGGELIEFGWIIALVGGGLAVGITTLAYLIRLVRGHRSWTAPLWGLIWLTIALVGGYVVMLVA